MAIIGYRPCEKALSTQLDTYTFSQNHSNYTILKNENNQYWSLGKGKFSQVFLGVAKQISELVAIKINTLQPVDKRAFESTDIYTAIEPDVYYKNALLEAKILHYVKDVPYVVQLIDQFPIQQNKHHALVFPVISSGNLEEILKEDRFALSIDDIYLFTKQMLVCLHGLREKNVIHSDIKPANLVWEKCKKKVTVLDFGLAKCFLKNAPFTYFHTIQPRDYRHLNILLHKPYDHHIDMWSLASIVYEMVMGSRIFSFIDCAEEDMDRYQLRKIQEVVRPFTYFDLENSPVAEKYFCMDHATKTFSYLRPEDEPISDFVPLSSQFLEKANIRKKGCEKAWFLGNLTRKMLDYNCPPTPKEALLLLNSYENLAMQLSMLNEFSLSHKSDSNDDEPIIKNDKNITLG